MVIKSTPQILKRVSIRWLPDPAYEDTVTIALNVGGWFLDLRVETADNALQWARAGERKTLQQDPLTFQWTRIIDSFGITDPDEAAFEELPNGDSLETGNFKKDGVLTAYEEVWRDVTGRDGEGSSAWILQSADGSTFLGKVADTYIGMQQEEPGSFAVRKEVYREAQRSWEVEFESGSVQEIPRAAAALEIEPQLVGRKLESGKNVRVRNHEYIVRGLHIAGDWNQA